MKKVSDTSPEFQNQLNTIVAQRPKSIKRSLIAFLAGVGLFWLTILMFMESLTGSWTVDSIVTFFSVIVIVIALIVVVLILYLLIFRGKGGFKIPLYFILGFMGLCCLCCLPAMVLTSLITGYLVNAVFTCTLLLIQAILFFTAIFQLAVTRSVIWFSNIKKFKKGQITLDGIDNNCGKEIKLNNVLAERPKSVIRAIVSGAILIALQVAGYIILSLNFHSNSTLGLGIYALAYFVVFGGMLGATLLLYCIYRGVLIFFYLGIAGSIISLIYAFVQMQTFNVADVTWQIISLLSIVVMSIFLFRKDSREWVSNCKKARRSIRQ